MYQPRTSDIVVLCLAIFFFNLILIESCPFHVDFVQYEKSIDNFYESRTIDGNVNGKHIYIYVMAILITPLHLMNINTFLSMILITGLFQAIILWLFFKLTKSYLKTYLAATTLTFLMFIGQPETIMLASIPLLLYFIYRDKPHSELFIMLAALIRLDFAIYYLFSRKKTAIIPIAFTLLQWLNGKFFIHSDFGINQHIFTAVLVFLLSYGTYSLLFLGMGKLKEKNLDWITHIIIILFLIVFLQFPSQKVFFFPVMLSFIIYDFKDPQRFKWLIIALVLINVIGAGIMLSNRGNLCTAEVFYEYGLNQTESTYFGVFQPYLDRYGLKQEPPFKYNISMSCEGREDFMIGEDWRNGQLFFLTYKFCLVES